MKRFLKYFLRGLLVFVPAGLTIFILVYIFTGLDKLFSKLFLITFPGLALLLGLFVTIGGIFLIGLFASNFVGKKLLGLMDKLFAKVPLVKMLYSAIRDLVEAFAGEKKKFDKPVLVTFGPNSYAKVVGFITRDNLENLGLKDHVAVYLPQSYNFAGNVLIFPKEAVKPLDIESSEAMTFIVSGGVAGERAQSQQ
ncbi:MAG: DUF502 domain-containing protein [Planctomycetes bacterium]|nr:DUF502 domain-containing protein [Planctomycetota bacterium]MCH8120702.1 DUF502 domain-containing protein [Planctomycetota bacterium]